MLSKKIPIKIDLPLEEENLICKIAEERITDESTFDECYVSLFPHTRVHRSQTKVFRIQFHVPRQTRNFIIKITDKKLVEREYRKWKEYVRDYINTGNIEQKIGPNRGALLYEHASGSAEDELKDSKELKDVIFNRNIELSKRLKIINDLYEVEMNNWNQGTCEIKKPKSLLNEYTGNGDYLRSRESDEIIKLFLRGDYNEKLISLCGHSIINPLFFLDKHEGFKQKICFIEKHLHGDLHPRNVIIDTYYRPHLIDFEWAHVGHALKDYVLLEASIKFFYMPKTLNSILEFERKLINFQKYKDIQLIPDLEGDIIFREAYCFIEEIRKKARKFCLWDDWQKEYLSSLFLVTYGLLKYEECNFPYALYSLGKIADTLSN